MLKRIGDIKFTSRWVIVMGVALVLFGTAGSRFSFGVFMKPLATEFDWSRGSLSGALAVAGLATGMLRPLAGWLADRFDARYIAATGLLLGGVALLGLSQIQVLWQFYLLFLLMGTGFTLASPATLTRLVSERFTKRRGLALSLAGSGSAIGETALVPLSAVALTLSGWRSAYIVLGLIILVVILPVSSILLSNWLSKRSGGVVEEVADPEDRAKQSKNGGPVCMWAPGEGMALKQAVKTPIFWALTAGFFT
ncbi:MAG: MFS transporter [Chloroflexi bacterium]|nr:MFS transporter [Chloroflexota bacterium]